jgi:hypothetical protein
MKTGKLEEYPENNRARLIDERRQHGVHPEKDR